MPITNANNLFKYLDKIRYEDKKDLTNRRHTIDDDRRQRVEVQKHRSKKVTIIL